MIHLLCDSDTHYLYNMLFAPGRVGKDFICNDSEESLAESVVLKLYYFTYLNNYYINNI